MPTDATAAQKIDPAKLRQILQFVLTLLLQAQSGGPKMAAAPGTEGGPDPEKVESDLAAALEGPQIEPGRMGGPMIDQAIEDAANALLDLARANVHAAVEILERVVISKIPYIGGV